VVLGREAGPIGEDTSQQTEFERAPSALSSIEKLELVEIGPTIIEMT
jgi:hypothetical protein